MRPKLYIAAFVVAGGVLVRPAFVSVPASAQPGATQDATTTLDDQTELAVTVYNSDIALVRDVRNLQLARGTSDLRFMDIAATVNPATVHFRSLSEPSRVSVLEQNYEYDLLEPDKLLRKYVGREVTLVRNRQESGSTRQEEVKARLLSYNNAPIWQIGGEIVTGLHADHIRFPELPDNLYSRPTLIWTLENDGAARHRVEASYLAGKLSWNADYVLTVARDDKAADIDGWVTVINGSGTSFRNAKLQLVAGDLNRVRQVLDGWRMMEMRAERAGRRAADGAGGVLRLPPLHARSKDDDQQQRDQAGQHARRHRRSRSQKRYVVEGQAFYYHNAQHPGAPIKDVVQVYYQFKNEEKAGLGMPMPAGVVRVYQSDSKGGVQFVGEDRIDHTPKDETLQSEDRQRVRRRSASASRSTSRRSRRTTYEVEYEITLRNHKATPITVEVNEPIGGTWRMLRSSHEWTKTAAWAAQFTVPVAADGTAVLKYRVRVTY